jgi:hypothetical protein
MSLLWKERIRQREQVEREKERELILSGKMSMADSHWKDDPVLKLHRDLDKVQRKVSKGQQVSISPTFYKQLFHIKVFFATFLFLQFDLVIFLAREYWRKSCL